MQTVLSRKSTLVPLALLAAFACGAAHAGERRFEPVPQSSLQRVQELNNVTIITGEGTRISAGASMSPALSRQALLSVSLKNTGSAAVDFSDSAINVTSGGKSLELRRLEEGMEGEGSDGYVRDKCANASSSSQSNCTIDSFTNRQHDRLAAAAQNQLAAGELATRQFQLTLPKRNKRIPTTLKISVTVGGEVISFEFRETN
ncbi:MAG: hypothetical protein ACREUQ_02750 [Burkholderiales bacterium]